MIKLTKSAFNNSIDITDTAITGNNVLEIFILYPPN
jgi:hypothetical protein